MQQHPRSGAPGLPGACGMAWLLPSAWPHPAPLYLKPDVGFRSHQSGPNPPGGPERGVWVARV